ncbi:hypothetical protein ACTFIU_002285 [Dictyostelium citrinum]
MEDNNEKNNFVSYDPRIILPPQPSSIIYPLYTPPQQQENYNINYNDENNNYSSINTTSYNEEFYKDNSFITLNDRFQTIEQQQQQLLLQQYKTNEEKPIEYTHSYVVGDDKLTSFNNNPSFTSQPYYPIIPPYQPTTYNDMAPTQEFVNRVAIRLREMEIEEINNNNNDPNDIHEENIMDASMSMLILLLGMFFFVPFIFSVLYLKSRDKYARRFAMVSMCIGIVYLIMIGIMPFFKGNDDDTTTTIIMS